MIAISGGYISIGLSIGDEMMVGLILCYLYLSSNVSAAANLSGPITADQPFCSILM